MVYSNACCYECDSGNRYVLLQTFILVRTLWHIWQGDSLRTVSWKEIYLPRTYSICCQGDISNFHFDKYCIHYELQLFNRAGITDLNTLINVRTDRLSNFDSNPFRFRGNFWRIMNSYCIEKWTFPSKVVAAVGYYLPHLGRFSRPWKCS